MEKKSFNPLIVIKDQMPTAISTVNSLVDCSMGPENQEPGVFVTKCGC